MNNAEHAVTCKFCRREMVIEIAHDYMGVVEKLLKLASCNRCADLRERRRKLEDSIARVIRPLVVYGERAPEKSVSHARGVLIVLTKKYTRLVADWVGSNEPWWEECIVQNLIDRPDKWQETMQHCWKLYEPAELFPKKV